MLCMCMYDPVTFEPAFQDCYPTYIALCVHTIGSALITVVFVV